MVMGNNFWMDLLDERPEIGFYSHLYGQGFGRQKEQTLSRAFPEIQSRFYARLGDMVRGGKKPTARWNDFLGGKEIMGKSFDFNQFYNQRTPQQRGFWSGSYAPRVRRIIGY